MTIVHPVALLVRSLLKDKKEPKEYLRLKSCPFCGGDSMLTGGGIKQLENIPYTAKCANLKCGVSVTRPTKEAVQAIWNRLPENKKQVKRYNNPRPTNTRS